MRLELNTINLDVINDLFVCLIDSHVMIYVSVIDSNVMIDVFVIELTQMQRLASIHN